MPNEVDHPEHYQAGGIETIEVIEAFGLNFRLGNCVKYVLRAGKKGNRLTDLEKAAWYLAREIEKEKGAQTAPKSILEILEGKRSEGPLAASRVPSAFTPGAATAVSFDGSAHATGRRT